MSGDKDISPATWGPEVGGLQAPGLLELQNKIKGNLDNLFILSPKEKEGEQTS